VVSTLRDTVGEPFLFKAMAGVDLVNVPYTGSPTNPRKCRMTHVASTIATEGAFKIGELSQEGRALLLTFLAPAPACSPRFATAYPRVFNDTLSENAFCCVAPGVRFSDLAILATGVFWRASVFSSRTSSLVHSRRFAFFAIFAGSNVFGAAS
jgi:hypothetical protein